MRDQLPMELESVKRSLENEEDTPVVDSLPFSFLVPLIMHGLRVDLIQPGRLLCSFTVPPRLVNSENTLHSGAIANIVDMVGATVVYTTFQTMLKSCVSVEINVSYMDAAYIGEEIEVEAKTLSVGNSVAVVSVELRKKETGKIIAQGRHTKYLLVQSKM